MLVFDVIIIRVLDLAYSKFKGIVAYVYNMLLNAFLIPKAVLEYSRIL